MSYLKFLKTLFFVASTKNYPRECWSILKGSRKEFINLDSLKILEFKYLHTKLMGLEAIEFMMTQIYPAY